MAEGDARRKGASPIRAGFGLALGCALVLWSLNAPVGAATAYAYKPLRMSALDGGGGCRSLTRGEEVSIWPAGIEAGERLVRLVEAPGCFARISDMSGRPRPALRTVEAGRWRFARVKEPGRRPSRGRLARYTKVNARSEPDLSKQFIVDRLDKPDSIRKVTGLVTGTDNKDWVEVELSTGQTAYIKGFLLEMT